MSGRHPRAGMMLSSTTPLPIIYGRYVFGLSLSYQGSCFHKPRMQNRLLGPTRPYSYPYYRYGFETRWCSPLIKVQHSLSRECEKINLRVLIHGVIRDESISTPVTNGRKNPVNGLAALLSAWILSFLGRLGTPEQKKVWKLMIGFVRHRC